MPKLKSCAQSLLRTDPFLSLSTHLVPMTFIPLALASLRSMYEYTPFSEKPSSYSFLPAATRLGFNFSPEISSI